MTMSKDTNNSDSDTGGESHTGDTVSALMNLAGPRADIPVNAEKRVHDIVRRHWQGVTQKRNFVRWTIPASLAAAILIAVAINFRAPEIAPQTIGTIAYVIGGTDFTTDEYVVGDAVFAGDTIDTVSSVGLSITLNDDVSLRIAANSSVRLDQSDAITLLNDQIYADSGDRIYRERHLTVNTTSGSATDIGTQFSVAMEGSRMSVAVRKGRVDVAHEQSVFAAEAGDKLILQTGKDEVVDKMAPYDPYWSWAESLAPDFDIKNRSLLDFLKWAARETGKTLSFSNDDVRMAAMGTRVVGSIRDFTPREAIAAVLATTQFDYEIDEQSITIRK